MKSKFVDNLLWMFNELVRLLTGFLYGLSHILAPAPPAIVFGFSFYAFALHNEIPKGLALAVGVSAALALEFVGLASFETLGKFWDRKGFVRNASMVGVFVYLGLGVYSAELEGGSRTLTYMTYAITAVAYLIRSAWETAKEQEEKRKSDEAKVEANEAFNAELSREDKRDAAMYRRETRRKQQEAKLALERMDKEAEIAERMAKIEAQTKVAMAKNASPQMASMAYTSPAQLVPQKKIWGYTHWRKVSDEHKLAMADMTFEEIREQCPDVHERTIKNWIKGNIPEYVAKVSGEVDGLSEVGDE